MKKTYFLAAVLLTAMVVSCGPTPEEIQAKEQAVTDSIAAYDAQVAAEAEAQAAAQAEAEAQAAKEKAVADSLAAVEASQTVKKK